MEVQLPHTAPIKFAKTILFREANLARVEVEFINLPSLPMLIESAAQSSSALALSTYKKGGYLVAMKNIKFHVSPRKNILEVEVVKTCTLGNMNIIDFKIFENEIMLVNGSLTIALDGTTL